MKPELEVPKNTHRMLTFSCLSWDQLLIITNKSVWTIKLIINYKIKHTINWNSDKRHKIIFDWYFSWSTYKLSFPLIKYSLFTEYIILLPQVLPQKLQHPQILPPLTLTHQRPITRFYSIYSTVILFIDNLTDSYNWFLSDGLIAADVSQQVSVILPLNTLEMFTRCPPITGFYDKYVQSLRLNQVKSW